MPDSPKPKLGLHTVVAHPMFGAGRIVAYEADTYVVLFKGGEAKRVAFSFEAMTATEPAGDPQFDQLKQAVREVLGDYGWLDVDLELAKRWTGGTLKLIPGKTETQPKDVPIEMFFKKLIGVRDKLRVLEQKINAHPVLSPEEKFEFEGYITRCYGSLTTFNVLFSAKESQFHGQSEDK
ncbi:MAG TPA: hypothetical protein VKX17_24965 [Planctomycetota bacterium]|nr:hypothetical protein [Planctomycetota bacterium]